MLAHEVAADGEAIAFRITAATRSSRRKSFFLGVFSWRLRALVVVFMIANKALSGAGQSG
jgi:hypothetical protein